jgi:adenylosuccinate lyase
MADAQVKDAIGPPEPRALLDPTTYVGLAPQIVARVVAETRASEWTAA